jgi:hypothetical protein
MEYYQALEISMGGFFYGVMFSGLSIYVYSRTGVLEYLKARNFQRQVIQISAANQVPLVVVLAY